MISRRKTCLLVFPDDWLQYSPTVLNLVELMAQRNIATKVIAFQCDHRVDDLSVNVEFLRVHRRVKQVLSTLNLYRKYKVARLVRCLLEEPAYDYYIGVDSVGAYALQAAGINCFDLLSLEVYRDTCFKKLQKSKIRGVVTQSEERYSYLFPDTGPQYWIVQNSPILRHKATSKAPNANLRLVFLGNAIPVHGIYECIDLISNFPELSLEICGLVLPEVSKYVARCPARDRISIRTEYLQQSDVQGYLKSFDVGLCLYNVTATDFNYQSIPSGKLFNYFSAGLPVIATDLIGLKPVRDFAAGVTLKRNSTEELKSAISKVQLDYESLSRGAAEAANYFSFGRMAQPYVESFT